MSEEKVQQAGVETVTDEHGEHKFRVIANDGSVHFFATREEVAQFAEDERSK